MNFTYFSITPLELKEILNIIKNAIQVTNPDNNIIAKNFIYFMIWN